ncbi:MAG: 6-bladed beta-propeller, partial [Bacteroidales bacterium]
KLSISEVENLRTIQVDPDHALTTGLASEIFSQYSFVPLETSQNSLLGSIDELILYNTCYYILDKLSKSIFAFDLNGKYRFKISAVGNGPGEYLELRNIYIDQQQACIAAMTGLKVLYYRIEDGRFVKEEKCNGKEPEALITSDTFCTYGYNIYLNGAVNNLRTFTPTKSLNEYLPINKDFKGFATRNNRFNSRNETATMYFNEFLGDTIFEITPTKLLAKSYVDFGKKKITPDWIRQLGQEPELTFIYKSPYCTLLSDYFETESVLGFQYVYKGRYYSYYSSKKRPFVYHYKSWKDNLAFGFVPVNILFATDSCLISWLPTGQLREVAKLISEQKTAIENSPGITKYIEILRNQGLDKISEDANPVLFMMHFHEHFQ